jgi:hypothetical protein
MGRGSVPVIGGRRAVPRLGGARGMTGVDKGIEVGIVGADSVTGAGIDEEVVAGD